MPQSCEPDCTGSGWNSVTYNNSNWFYNRPPPTTSTPINSHTSHSLKIRFSVSFPPNPRDPSLLSLHLSILKWLTHFPFCFMRATWPRVSFYFIWSTKSYLVKSLLLWSSSLRDITQILLRTLPLLTSNGLGRRHVTCNRPLSIYRPFSTLHPVLSLNMAVTSI